MRRRLHPAPVSGLRAATAARYRQQAARHGDSVLTDYWLRKAARWESTEPIEHCYGWQLAPEYCPPGGRADEFSVGPAGELVLVRRVYPSPSEVRCVPVGSDPRWGST